jgi:hypothetical protein
LEKEKIGLMFPETASFLQSRPVKHYLPGGALASGMNGDGYKWGRIAFMGRVNCSP